MRKRRVILYDDEPTILKGLTLFFEDRGYEVFAFHTPVVCAVYDEQDLCAQARPCADIMITDLEMPRMSGLELLVRQSRRGCQLTPLNKAVLSGSLSAETIATIRGLGCQTFHKPCRLSTLAAWVQGCEQRMDLTKSLGANRRERREACCYDALFNEDGRTDAHAAQVVNVSGSGLCLQAERPLAVAQILSLRTSLPLAATWLQVRWTRPVGGGCLAGMSFL